MLEQIAGDLIEPRVDAGDRALNESLIGPMAMRLGERRHGDNAEIEGITQEAMTNVIDTLSKGFLGTTVACAQCHDHKLDAVAQRDYYALAGIFMSTRWGARSVDAVDPNVAVIDELRQIKQAIRDEIAQEWLDSKESLVAKLQAIPADDQGGRGVSRNAWRRFGNGGSNRRSRRPISMAERQRRIAENKANLTLLADFTQRGWGRRLAVGWFRHEAWAGARRRDGRGGRRRRRDRPASARGPMVARLVDAAGRGGSQSTIGATIRR